MIRITETERTARVKTMNGSDSKHTEYYTVITVWFLFIPIFTSKKLIRSLMS